MLTSLKKRLDREDEGFTLIELMVVVLIIAILLAIAIPTFLGAQDRAKDRGAQSNLRNALTAAKTIATDNEGIFTGVDATTLDAAEPVLNPTTTQVGASSDSKDIYLAKSAGLLGNAAEGTTDGVLFLGVKSASGKYFGICTDYRGDVRYAQGDTSARTLTNCTAAKF